jgi:hypothetical protein
MTDYTGLTIGTKMDRGEIKTCPYCGRIGLVKIVEEMIHVIHSDWALPTGKESLSLGGDECPKDGILEPSGSNE